MPVTLKGPVFALNLPPELVLLCVYVVAPSGIMFQSTVCSVGCRCSAACWLMWAGGTQCVDAISVLIRQQHFTSGCQGDTPSQKINNKCLFILGLLVQLHSSHVSHSVSGDLVVRGRVLLL